MKLGKFIKFIDTINDCILFDVKKEKVVWKGATYLLDCAINDSKEDRNVFFKECEDDEEFESIDLVKSAYKYADYKLDRNDDGEAVLFFPRINERGVALLTIQINIKKC